MQRVKLSAGGKTVDALIVLGELARGSLMLEFDDALPVSGGLMLGQLAALRLDDGSWVDLITGAPVQIETVDG